MHDPLLIGAPNGHFVLVPQGGEFRTLREQLRHHGLDVRVAAPPAVRRAQVRAVPSGSAAGDRYAPEQLTQLDSEIVSAR